MHSRRNKLSSRARSPNASPKPLPLSELSASQINVLSGRKSGEAAKGVSKAPIQPLAAAGRIQVFDDGIPEPAKVDAPSHELDASAKPLNDSDATPPETQQHDTLAAPTAMRSSDESIMGTGHGEEWPSLPPVEIAGEQLRRGEDIASALGKSRPSTGRSSYSIFPSTMTSKPPRLSLPFSIGRDRSQSATSTASYGLFPHLTPSAIIPDVPQERPRSRSSPAAPTDDFMQALDECITNLPDPVPDVPLASIETEGVTTARAMYPPPPRLQRKGGISQLPRGVSATRPLPQWRTNSLSVDTDHPGPSPRSAPSFASTVQRQPGPPQSGASSVSTIQRQPAFHSQSEAVPASSMQGYPGPPPQSAASSVSAIQRFPGPPPRSPKSPPPTFQRFPGSLPVSAMSSTSTVQRYPGPRAASVPKNSIYPGDPQSRTSSAHSNPRFQRNRSGMSNFSVRSGPRQGNAGPAFEERRTRNGPPFRGRGGEPANLISEGRRPRNGAFRGPDFEPIANMSDLRPPAPVFREGDQRPGSSGSSRSRRGSIYRFLNDAYTSWARIYYRDGGENGLHLEVAPDITQVQRPITPGNKSLSRPGSKLGHPPEMSQVQRPLTPASRIQSRPSSKTSHSSGSKSLSRISRSSESGIGAEVVQFPPVPRQPLMFRRPVTPESAALRRMVSKLSQSSARDEPSDKGRLLEKDEQPDMDVLPDVGEYPEMQGFAEIGELPEIRGLPDIGELPETNEIPEILKVARGPPPVAPRQPTAMSDETTHSKKGSRGSESPGSAGFPDVVYIPRVRPRQQETESLISEESGITALPPLSAGIIAASEPFASMPHTPRLSPDRRVGHSILSDWRPPSYEESQGIFDKVNRQIVLFSLGFVFPFAWILAAFLSLPARPEMRLIGPEDYFGGGPAQTDLFDTKDVRRYQKARRWRVTNRIMSFLGLCIIAIIGACAGVAATR